MIRCGYIGSPTNGKVRVTKTSYGGVATFECDDGYDLVGPNMRTCEVDGKWTKTNPECSSRVYCSPIQLNSNSVVIYATEKGRLSANTTSFRSGTLAEIQCAEGTYPSGENLITCLKDGTWDNEAPECLEETKTCSERCEVELEAAAGTTIPTLSVEALSIKQLRPDRTFWKNLHSYLFFGCSPAEKTKRSLLCDRYNSNLTDLTTLTSTLSSSTIRFSHGDQQLLNLFQQTLASINFPNIDTNNFFTFILYQNETEPDDQFDAATESSIRLMLCFYLHMLSFEEDSKQQGSASESSSASVEIGTEDVGEKIKRLLRQIVQPVFEKFLEPMDQREVTTRRSLNAVQALIASKVRDGQS